MSQVIYNGTSLGTAFGQSPLVTRNVIPLFRGDGRLLGVTENYQLIGQLTGCAFVKITGDMATLSNIFSKDFGTLQFLDDDGFSIVHSGARINSVSFEQGSEVGVQGYTIDITTFPPSYFENAGIISKDNSWSVTQEQNGNLSISHTISAKGANTAPQFNNALTNAKNFVLQYTGFNPPPLFPFFISGFSGSLDSRVENINRLDAEYSITESYIGRTGSSVTQELTVDLQSGTDGIISVSVQGSFTAGKGSDINLARIAYSGFNSYATATGVYDHYRGTTGLQPNPLSSGITEDYQNNSLSFDIQFNDWPQVSYRHVYDVRVVSGDNGIITATINGDIQGIGKLPLKYDRAYQFFNTLNIYSIVNPEYLEFVGGGYPYVLRNVPIESGCSNDRFAGTIGYNATFDNRTLPLSCSGIKIFDIQISKQCATRIVSPMSIPHSISGLDSVDLLYNSRATITVGGTIVVERPYTTIHATGFIAQYVNNKFASQFLASGSKSKIRLDSVNIEQDINENTATFNVQYSFDEPLSYSPSGSYIFLTGLFL